MIVALIILGHLTIGALTIYLLGLYDKKVNDRIYADEALTGWLFLFWPIAILIICFLFIGDIGLKIYEKGRK